MQVHLPDFDGPRFAAELAFEVIAGLAITARFGTGQGGEREDEAIPEITRLFGFAQPPWHETQPRMHRVEVLRAPLAPWRTVAIGGFAVPFRIPCCRLC